MPQPASTRPYVSHSALRWRLVLHRALVIGVVSAFVLVFFPTSMSRQSKEALHDRARTIATLLKTSVTESVLFGDKEATEDAVEATLAADDVLFAAVVDKDGETLAVGAVDTTLGDTIHLTQSEADTRTFRLVMPIEYEGWEVGRIYLGMSTENMRASIGQAWRYSAAVSTLLFLVGMVCAYLLGGLVSGPLKQISAETTIPLAENGPQHLSILPADLKVGLGTESTTLISDAQHAIAERSELERFYEQILDDLPVQIAVLDLGGRFLYANPAFTGSTERQRWIIGRTPDDYWRRTGVDVDADVNWEDAVSRCIDETNTVSFEQTMRGTDGGEHQLIRSLSPVLDGSGSVTRLIGYGLDITDRRNAEKALHDSKEQLRQVQRMEAVGRLAAGVAHDFNNLLTVISGHSNLLLLELEDEDPRRAYVESIVSAGDSAASLTQQLLAFSRKQVLQPKVVDLNTVVGQVSKMLRRLLGEDITVSTTLCPTIGRIMADPGQLEQVIMNLAVNARDAMSNGGRLAISTNQVVLDEAFVQQHTGSEPGDCVVLTIADTGVGMDEATRDRAFEPFFTTKERGKGTGLGLSTVYGIVKQSGGYITIESEKAKGTTFRIYFPRITSESADTSVSDESRHNTSGSETILLVEDAEGVRQIARRILNEAGYTVIEAEGGASAIRRCHEHEGEINLLLTDIVMPHMNGDEVAREIGRIAPQVKVLFMSGYTDDAIIERGVFESGIPLLEKPFSVHDLLHKVRVVLDEAA